MIILSIISLVVALVAVTFSTMTYVKGGPQGEMGPQGPQGEKGEDGKDGKDGVSVIKETPDLTGEDIVKLLSHMRIINLPNTEIHAANGFYQDKGKEEL